MNPTLIFMVRGERSGTHDNSLYKYKYLYQIQTPIE